MTINLDVAFMWQLLTFAFVAGGGYVGMHLTVRWMERKQDIKLDALEKKVTLEIQALRDMHEAHVIRYEREHSELRGKVESKGESTVTTTERLAQVEKRLDEKVDAAVEMIRREFQLFASSLRDTLAAAYTPRRRVALVGGVDE